MKHISLFSGIGGFDLAAEWMGWENIAHCEWNPFGLRVLKYYWPNAISYEDITKTDFSIHRGNIDIVTGGFPCQPYSSAGKRKGKEDERHLWPEMLRAIREIQPSWVVGENVRGLTTWNDGLVFDEVQADLEAEGYEVTPFLLPASGVNAPHERYRIWFVAYSHSSKQRNNIGTNNGTATKIWRRKKSNVSTEFLSSWATSHANSSMRKRRESWNQTESREESIKKQSRRYRQLHRTNWENFPLESPLCPGNDGISFQLDGITISKWRNESIKGGVNAIVPQVAFQIFKAIQEYQTINNQKS